METTWKAQPGLEGRSGTETGMAFFAPVRGMAGMEAMERLACRMAHDFNNALTSITGLGSLMERDLEGGMVRSEHLRGILDAARRAGTLTSDLLAYSRNVSRDLRSRSGGSMDLRQFVEARRELWQSRLGAAVALEVLPCASAATIHAPESTVEEILVRILENIRDALRDGGIARVGISLRELGPAFCAERGLVPGEYAAIRVSDNGPGMSPEIAERAFDPFFTTRSRHGARGLGLAVAHGLTRDLGGHIECMTRPHRGCVFTVFFPVAGNPDAATRGEAAPVPAIDGVFAPVIPTTGAALVAAVRSEPVAEPRKPASTDPQRETILVVEDEPMVRELVTRSLGYLGYHVLQASDGQAGYDLALAHAGEIDIIFSDIVMPRMNGPEMVQRLRESGLEFRVLFTTGFTESANILENGELRDGVRILPKPYATRELAARIRECLDAA